MLKLLGSGCVLAAGFLLCWRQRNERRRVTELLRQLSAALESMGDEIRLERTPLPRLLEKTACRCGGAGAAFFRAVGRGGESDIAEAWRCAAEDLPVPERERQVLAEVAGMLSGDEEQVCRGLYRAAERLRREWEHRQSCAADAERQAAALCLSGAAMTIILLI